MEYRIEQIANHIHTMTLGQKVDMTPRLIMPADHPRNPIGCRMLFEKVSYCYFQGIEEATLSYNTWIPLEPISIEKQNDIRRG